MPTDDLAASVRSALVLDGRHLNWYAAVDPIALGLPVDAHASLVITPRDGSAATTAEPSSRWTDTDGVVCLSGLADLAGFAGAAPTILDVVVNWGGQTVRLCPEPGFDSTPNDAVMEPNPVDPRLGARFRPAVTKHGHLRIGVLTLSQDWGVDRASVDADTIVIEGALSARPTETIGLVRLEQSNGDGRIDATLRVHDGRWTATVPVSAFTSHPPTEGDRSLWLVVGASSPDAEARPVRPFRSAVRGLDEAYVRPRWRCELGDETLRINLRYGAKGNLSVSVQHGRDGGDDE